MNEDYLAKAGLLNVTTYFRPSVLSHFRMALPSFPLTPRVAEESRGLDQQQPKG